MRSAAVSVCVGVCLFATLCYADSWNTTGVEGLPPQSLASPDAQHPPSLLTSQEQLCPQFLPAGRNYRVLENTESPVGPELKINRQGAYLYVIANCLDAW
jgi:hypothetical protein